MVDSNFIGGSLAPLRTTICKFSLQATFLPRFVTLGSGTAPGQQTRDPSVLLSAFPTRLPSQKLLHGYYT